MEQGWIVAMRDLKDVFPNMKDVETPYMRGVWKKIINDIPHRKMEIIINYAQKQGVDFESMSLEEKQSFAFEHRDELLRRLFLR